VRTAACRLAGVELNTTASTAGVRVAAVQMNAVADVAANLAHASALVAEAADGGARVVVLPENFSFMGHDDTERLAVAEADGDGPAQAMLAETAARHRVWLVGGTIPISVSGDARPAAACPVYDADGRRVARYDKVHLFDVALPDGESYRESDGIAPGRAPVIVDTPAGRLGLAVCYDLRFPEFFRAMVAAGCTLFTVPAAFTAATGRAHWEVLLRARAVENLSYVIAPGQYGRHASGRETWGHSMIVDPWGQVLASRDDGSGIVVADLDLNAQQALRTRFPVLQHGRMPGAPGFEPTTEGGQ